MKLLQGDCLELLKTIPDGSIDMVLTDPPYGTTACKWDNLIDFAAMWKELKRIVKERSAICLFGSEPFSSRLRLSLIKEFKYDWIWEKATGSNFASLKYQPMKEHEIISVFSKKTHNYYPIKQPRKGSGAQRCKYGGSANDGIQEQSGVKRNNAGKMYDQEMRNPSSVQYFNNREKDRGYHPTQKPVALLEYLIKTYTLPGETVLDFTMGSGSTGVACKNTGRDFIGIELDEKYFAIAKERIELASYCESQEGK